MHILLFRCLQANSPHHLGTPQGTLWWGREQETKKSKKRVCGMVETGTHHGTEMSLANAVQPASEPVITSTP